MYRKQMYPLNIQIHIFLTWGFRSGKTFTFKLFIQGWLRIYNKDLSSNLTKIKELLMASTCKAPFHIDGQIIHKH